MHDKIRKAIDDLLDKERQTLPEDSQKLLTYLTETKEGKLAFQRWAEGLDDTGECESIDLERIYKKIQQHVESSKDAAPHKKIRRLNAVQLFQRAAAVLLLPVLCFTGYVLYRNYEANARLEASSKFINVDKQQLEYYSPAGARLRVVLPDSTEVWLNGNSRLVLSKTFGMSTRTVRLLGQGFFHVKHNEQLPFIVNAGSLSIKALGTSFNVFAYPEENREEAVLISGKIAVHRTDGRDRRTGEVVMLQPDQKVSLHKGDEQLMVENVYAEPYQSWTKGKLIFNDDPLEKVVNVLEHYYNMRIIVADSRLLSFRFTATIEDSSIEQLMEYLKFSSPIAYEISRNQIVISMK